VPRDPKKAAKWIERAADSGYPDAQYDIGVMHATGEGVTRDLSTAYMWLDLAADTKGLEPGIFWKNIDKLLTPAQRLEAEQLKKTWGK
jgi:TPR repeat protein